MGLEGRNERLTQWSPCLVQAATLGSEEIGRD